MNKLLSFISAVLVVLLSTLQSYSQCAMCRVAVENNVSNDGDKGMASALNSGIVYLFVAPYILIMVVGFLWYRNSRKTLNGKIKSEGTSRS